MLVDNYVDTYPKLSIDYIFHHNARNAGKRGAQLYQLLINMWPTLKAYYFSL